MFKRIGTAQLVLLLLSSFSAAREVTPQDFIATAKYMKWMTAILAVRANSAAQNGGVSKEKRFCHEGVCHKVIIVKTTENKDGYLDITLDDADKPTALSSCEFADAEHKAKTCQDLDTHEITVYNRGWDGAWTAEIPPKREDKVDDYASPR